MWINLLDGGRFVGTFSTCSYMAGCLECFVIYTEENIACFASSSLKLGPAQAQLVSLFHILFYLVIRFIAILSNTLGWTKDDQKYLSAHL